MMSFWKIIVAVSAALILGSVAFSYSDSESQHSGDGKRPNIIILETDDQTAKSIRVMRNTLGLLAAEGITFDNSYASYPLCAPSRATLLSGQYAHNHGVVSNYAPRGGFYKFDSSNTLPVWLQSAGYYTVHVGKYLNEYGERDPLQIPPGWSEWHASVDPSTYRYFGYTLNENGVLQTYCNDFSPWCYSTDIYAQKAVEVIHRQVSGVQPFFLWVAFLAVHSGEPVEPDDPPDFGTPAPAPQDRNVFSARKLPMRPSFNEADVSDKPRKIRRLPLLTNQIIAEIRENYQQRLETLLAVDRAVEKIVTALAQEGQLDQTLIIFTSDNGFYHGEHRITRAKGRIYEPSTRVPLILRGPGFRGGEHREQPVANVDLAATILALANAPSTLIMDGVDLSVFASNPDTGLEGEILLEGGSGKHRYAAIRTGRWKYAEYANGERELYDMRKDPYEVQSLHADPRYLDIQNMLSEKLAQLRRCKGVECQQARTSP